MSTLHEKYMQRCLQLAKNGFGNVSPNPMVGAVIVNKDRIIGEGYHQKYGEAHAEVNAINSVEDKSLLKTSTMYVSLEPCSHFGKTPPCADMIIENKIPEVVIGSIDPNPKVAGGGIKKLKDAGLTLTTGVLVKECDELNKRFFTYHLKKRPYIILKWAETADGFIDICRKDPDKIKNYWITNEFCRTLVHKWRTEEDAFMIGANTVINDNPHLTARNWSGRNPVRVIVDKNAELSKDYKILDKSAKTIVINSKKNLCQENIAYIKSNLEKDSEKNILTVLYENKIQSLVIEGGAQLLNSFISSGLWDEARVFTGQKIFKRGLKAPVFNFHVTNSFAFDDCIMNVYINPVK